jgi:transposase
MQEFCELKSEDIELKAQMSVIKVLDKQIAKIEAQIKSGLEGDQELKETLSLITSIKGIGLIVGAYILAYTDNFTRFEDSRKFACYIGTAPFPFSSGTSVRGRTKVSHLAYKKLKSLLDLAAKSALQADPELKQYYRRRLEEGKRKMSTAT